jgi:cathepsin L
MTKLGFAHARTAMIFLITLSSLGAAGPLYAQVRLKQPALAIAPAKVDYVRRERTASPETKKTLAEMREQLKARNRRFSIGYTAVMDLPLEMLAATKFPKELPVSSAFRVADKLREIDRTRYQEFKKLNPEVAKKIETLRVACSPTAQRWDWRWNGKVTRVKAQKCGSCWAYSGLGIYESSNAIRNGLIVGESGADEGKDNTSEQYILNCCQNCGNCKGGMFRVLGDFLISNGTSSESSVPDLGNDWTTTQCPANALISFRAAAWGFVDPPRWDRVASVDLIKQALCEHGPLGSGVWVTNEFKAYTGIPDPVYDETDKAFLDQDGKPMSNHGIMIIGWDDKLGAWLVKNSWGQGWGNNAGFGTERGYGWIKYGSNNIGMHAIWIEAMRRYYRLPANWIAVLKDARISVKPLPHPDPGPLRIRPLPER